MFLTGLGIGGQSLQVGMNYCGDSAARGMAGYFGGGCFALAGTRFAASARL